MTPAAHLGALLQLASPQLPVGGFSYSQGLESAIDAGLVRDASSAQAWITDHFEGTFATWELPTVAIMHALVVGGKIETLHDLNLEFIASRETRELREETLQMGWSLQSLLTSILPQAQRRLAPIAGLPRLSYPAAFACGAAALELDAVQTAFAYAFAWLENQVAAALKAVPLGQVAGQRILLTSHGMIESAVARAVQMPLEDRHSFAPALAMLSARHETQYSRLFRS
jgi:urease accessory protein